MNFNGVFKSYFKCRELLRGGSGESPSACEGKSPPTPGSAFKAFPLASAVPGEQPGVPLTRGGQHPSPAQEAGERTLSEVLPNTRKWGIWVLNTVQQTDHLTVSKTFSDLSYLIQTPRINCVFNAREFFKYHFIICLSKFIIRCTTKHLLLFVLKYNTIYILIIYDTESIIYFFICLVINFNSIHYKIK